MRPTCALRSLFACALIGLADAGVAQGQVIDTFVTVMANAMTRMHRDMMRTPSGDADRDFAAMMIPHHRGAVEMAEAELRFGHDPVLRRLAQGIIVEQQQEIAVMQRALAALSPPAAAPIDPIHKEH
ncbi:MAG: hypothetical protein NVS2B11_02530 [Acetobacteraceae bacterium]